MKPEDDLSPETPGQLSKPNSVTGGESPEQVDDSSRGGSERLRHRDRAVTAYDYIPMVLEEFPTIGRAVVAVGIVGSLVLIGWMLSDIKGPQGRVGPDPLLDLATSTATSISASPTPLPSEATATDPIMATDQPTEVPSATPHPIEINFNADSYTIVRGACTTLRWEVLGAERVRLLGAEVEHTEAEKVCPTLSTTYTLVAENEARAEESSMLIEVLAPTATPAMGCTGYDENGQLICKETCSDNDPGGACELE
ncbi:MAG: hypothetical protein ACLFWD_01160 [Anaerolineales bacterium]